MTKTEEALCRLLGGKVLTLGAETDEPVAEKILALAAELPELRRKAGEADKLALAAEQEQKRQLIDKAISENRATNAEREGLMKLDVAWLSAELPKRAQNAVPTAPLPEGQEDEEEKNSLTDEEKAFEDYPLCTHLVLRDRTVLAPDRHSVRVTVMRNDGARCEMPPFTFPVTEKIGGGDAFNGGMLHGLLEGTDLADATYFAVAAFAMKHTVPGDVLAVPEQKIRDFMSRTEGLLP